jgi:hypothetical protein
MVADGIDFHQIAIKVSQDTTDVTVNLFSVCIRQDVTAIFCTENDMIQVV